MYLYVIQLAYCIPELIILSPSRKHNKKLSKKMTIICIPHPAFFPLTSAILPKPAALDKYSDKEQLTRENAFSYYKIKILILFIQKNRKGSICL